MLLVYNEKSFDSGEHSAVFKSLMKYIRKLLKYQVHRIKSEKGVRQGNKFKLFADLEIIFQKMNWEGITLQFYDKILPISEFTYELQEMVNVRSRKSLYVTLKIERNKRNETF